MQVIFIIFTISRLLCQKIDQEGERLSKPAACPDDVYQLMLQCWAHEADVSPLLITYDIYELFCILQYPQS